MSLETELNRPVSYQRCLKNHCRSPCSCNGKGKSNTYQIQTQFFKINRQNRISSDVGHSKITNNNFSRRNSIATTGSSTLSTKNKHIKNRYNLFQSKESWSMPHWEKKKRNTNFTEQRSNYEQMLQQQLPQQQQWPWVSEQVIHDKEDTKFTKFCPVIHLEFMALNEFRLENRKDCFSDRHYRILDMRPQTPSNHIRRSKTKLQRQSSEFNGNLIDIDDAKHNISRSLSSSFSSLSLESINPIPYANRQRILRDQLTKDASYRKPLTFKSDKSVALSHFTKS